MDRSVKQMRKESVPENGEEHAAVVRRGNKEEVLRAWEVPIQGKGTRDFPKEKLYGE